MQFKVEIEVTTRQGVLNPEEKAITQALHGHNFAVSNLIMNKKFYFLLESANSKEAQHKAEEICQDFLANPIIQDYTIQIKEA